MLEKNFKRMLKNNIHIFKTDKVTGIYKDGNSFIVKCMTGKDDIQRGYKRHYNLKLFTWVIKDKYFDYNGTIEGIELVHTNYRVNNLIRIYGENNNLNFKKI